MNQRWPRRCFYILCPPDALRALRALHTPLTSRALQARHTSHTPHTEQTLITQPPLLLRTHHPRAWQIWSLNRTDGPDILIPLDPIPQRWCAGWTSEIGFAEAGDGGVDFGPAGEVFGVEEDGEDFWVVGEVDGVVAGVEEAEDRGVEVGFPEDIADHADDGTVAWGEDAGVIFHFPEDGGGREVVW